MTGPTPFFSTCFAPRRLVGGICLADLVRSWARHHPTADVGAAIDRIEELLRTGADDDGLRILVLGTAGCGYDPGTHGLTMQQWLALVRGLLIGRPDAVLPDAAWEPLTPWPGQDVGPLAALRHLLDGYLGQAVRDATTSEGAVERFVAIEGPARAAALVRDVDALLGQSLGEERLRIVVLGRLRSPYDPRPDLPGGRTMAQWLRAVRGAAVSCTVEG